MTSHGNGLPLVYTVRFTGNAPEQVKLRYQEAAATGKGLRFLTTLREIIERLRHHPHSFGEPLYRLPGLRLMVYQGAIAPLVVYYGVHEERPVVFVRAVRVMS